MRKQAVRMASTKPEPIYLDAPSVTLLGSIAGIFARAKWSMK
jgi:hypothetical protein